MIASLIGILIYSIVLIVIAYLFIWVIGTIAPGHPVIIDKLIWIVVVLIIALWLLSLLVVLPAPYFPRVR